MKVIKSTSTTNSQRPNVVVWGVQKTSIGRTINFDIQAGSNRYVCACISEK